MGDILVVWELHYLHYFFFLPFLFSLSLSLPLFDLYKVEPYHNRYSNIQYPVTSCIPATTLLPFTFLARVGCLGKLQSQ